MFFELKNAKYLIKITYRDSLIVLPEKFGINLCKIFTDGDAAADTMQALILDDERTLKLAWHYIEPKSDLDWEQFLDLMEGKDLERFREDFWAAVVNFSGPLKKNLLQEMWSQFKRDLKKADLTSMISDASLSDSNPEVST